MMLLDSSPFASSFDVENGILQLAYFSVEVLERYYHDPRYLVFYNDYRGSICLDSQYIKSDSSNFDYVKNFGLAYQKDNRNMRVVIVFAADLFDMPIAQQHYWRSYFLDNQEDYIPNLR